RDYLPWLRAVRRASRLCDPRVRYLRAHSIRVHESGIDWEVDGEYVGASPLQVSVLPRSLAVVLPGSQERASAGAGRRGGVIS
ncbi:MAG TPA: hypothetical protein VMM85_06145, partial [Methylomirabilota bacterium]|nr:hypothetical protein [Methylomirabilota bacterium]